MIGRGIWLVALLTVACTAPSAGPVATTAPAPTVTATTGPLATGSATPRPFTRSRTEDVNFRSTVLSRPLPYTIYLPPGYDADTVARYPVAYMLHGGCGCKSEWADYGLLAAADRLMTAGTIAPFIIVLPQGDQEYWVDHVIDARTGANGEKWGTYVAREIVPEIDRRYRTVADQRSRALGGLSMGGHAAIQLPLNFPGIWGVLGAHSPSIRPLGSAPTYLGTSQAEYSARDPLSLIRAKPDLVRGHIWWIDSGDVDPWRAQATAIHDELTRLGVSHDWRPYPGDHSAVYWGAHVDDYLRYYGTALCPLGCPRAP